MRLSKARLITARFPTPLLMILLAVASRPDPVAGQAPLPVHEDFEACQPGHLPAPWQDVAQVIGDCAVLPSASCSQATDSRGVATSVLEIVPARCRAQGIWLPLPSGESYSVTLDLRVDQFSDSQGGGQDGPLYLGLARADPCDNPSFWRQVGVYVDAGDRTWYFYDVEPAAPCGGLVTGQVRNTGATARALVWYRIRVRFDIPNALLQLEIEDLENGQRRGPYQFGINRARHAEGFDALIIADWETTAAQRWNHAVYDNIFVQEGLRGLEFLRGDCNDDGNVDLADATCALSWLFAGGPVPGCLAAVNTNGDDKIDIADPVSLLNFLFGEGPTITDPFPDCGPGTSAADKQLGCERPPDCQ